MRRVLSETAQEKLARGCVLLNPGGSITERCRAAAGIGGRSGGLGGYVTLGGARAHAGMPVGGYQQRARSVEPALFERALLPPGLLERAFDLIRYWFI